MRKPRAETKRALRDAIVGSGTRQNQWCVLHGVSPSAVSDCLRGAAMSSSRENIIRDALGLPEIVTEHVMVVYEPDRQEVVVKDLPRSREYKTRQFRATPEEAEAIDGYMKKMGYRSFSDFIRKYFGDDEGSVVWYFAEE